MTDAEDIAKVKSRLVANDYGETCHEWETCLCWECHASRAHRRADLDRVIAHCERLEASNADAERMHAHNRAVIERLEAQRVPPATPDDYELMRGQLTRVMGELATLREQIERAPVLWSWGLAHESVARLHYQETPPVLTRAGPIPYVVRAYALISTERVGPPA